MAVDDSPSPPDSRIATPDLSVVKIRLLRKISHLQEPDSRSTESCKLGP